ncbi:MAG: metalloregulator ArsR/SmtB family transcription factor [Thermoleophilia bacterium]|nr:metalloregulator ArsR/SmtB family transcription factor [Thermoleophilia bacterium]
MHLDNSILVPPVDALARIFKALSEPARLRIVLALSDDCRPVSDVVEATGLPQPLVSHHLRILRDAGVAQPDRRGGFVYY